MNDIQKENLSLSLEKMVDAYGLKRVVELLAGLAHDKAAHIAENWQDIPLSKVWSKRGNALDLVLTQISED